MSLVGLAIVIATRQAPRVAGTLTVETGKSLVAHQGGADSVSKSRQRLQVGDALSVQSGRANFVFGANREIWQVTAGSKVRVGVRGFVTLAGSKPRLIGRLDQDLSDPRAQAMLHLGSTTRGEDFSIAPIGAFRHGPIQLKWSNPPWACTAFAKAVSITNLRILWTSQEVKSESESIEIPGSVTKDGGWVNIRLTLRAADGMTKATETQVRIRGTAELQELNRQVAALDSRFSTEPKFLAETLAGLYASYGLVDDMDRELALIYSDPQEALGERGLLLLRTGLRRPALESLQQAAANGESGADVKEALESLQH